MPTTEAQAEFDALMSGRSSHPLSHPEDTTRSSSSSPQNRKNGEKRNLRNGNYNNRDSDYEDEGSDHNAGQALGRQNKGGKTRYFIPSTQRQANTGPKGVIADAQAFEQARRAHRSVTSLAQTVGTSQRAMVQDKSNGRQDARQLSEGSDESDDDFMARWRQTRLQELTRKHGPMNYLGQQARNGPRYGNLSGVDADGYLDAVEMTKSDTVVCVYIYDDASEVSREIEGAVIDVARAYPATRFVKLHYEEAQMDAMGVPAMLAYRGGDKFADMVPIIDEIPLEDELSPETMAAAMKRKGMLR